MSVGGTERDRGPPRTASEPHVEGVARRVAVVGRCGAVGAADHRPEAELGRLQHVLVADFGRGRGDVVAVAVVGRVLQAVPVADNEHADVRHPRPVHQEPVLLQQGRRRSRVRGRRAGRLVAQRRHAQVEQVGKSAVRRQRPHPPFFSGPRFAYLRTQTVRSHECRIKIIVIVFSGV